MVVMHALMGGLAAEARGDSFAAGAIGAGLNEALVADLDKLVSRYSPENREALLTMASQLTGLIGVVAADPDASYAKLETGAWAAKNSTQYNHELHRKQRQELRRWRPGLLRAET
jgi:filamentous hemagglutinin